MLWKVEGFFFYFLLFVGQQREFTREKRRMTVFVLMVNFLTYLVTYYVEQVQVNVLNSVKTFCFPHPFQLVITKTAVFWHCFI